MDFIFLVMMIIYAIRIESLLRQVPKTPDRIQAILVGMAIYGMLYYAIKDVTGW